VSCHDQLPLCPSFVFALLVEEEPAVPAVVKVADAHADDGAHARDVEEHHGEERLVAEGHVNMPRMAIPVLPRT